MNLFKKKSVKIIGIIILILLVLTPFFYGRVVRVIQVMHLFDADVIVENFRAMDKIFAKRIVKRQGPVWELPLNTQSLPATYRFNGQEKNIENYLTDTWTTGFIVIKDDKIVHEKYYRGNNQHTKVISWSVAKSIVSAVFGIAVAEGHIKSIDEPVTNYVPYLKGSGYENVRIKDVLQMSSGVRFNEDYGDFHSDINKMGRALALNTSIDDFVKSLRNERKPGEYNHYVSMDTQVLGMIVREATKQNFSSYMEQKLWGQIGAEEDSFWLLDNKGMELVFGGFNAVLRDYARFGLLYLHQGQFQDKQIVPRDWVRASVTPDAPHLMPGRKEKGSPYTYGYGFQWWIPQDSDGDFIAIGIYNQYIWISPKERIVIAKSSAYPDYNKNGTIKTIEGIAVYRAIAKHLRK